MAEEILRREGENILNEAGEVVARFEANNIIGEFGGGSIELKKYEYTGNGASELHIPKALGIRAILSVSATNINVEYATLHTVIVTDETLIADILYKSGGSITSTAFLVKYDENDIIFYGGSDAGARLNYSGGNYKLYYI